MKLFYNKFGMYIDNDDDIIVDDNNLKINLKDREIKKCYQQIEFDTSNENEQIQNNTINSEENNNIKNNSPKKNEIKQESTKNNVDENNLNNAINFISEEIINMLYKEKDKEGKKLLYLKNQEADIQMKNQALIG